MGVIVTVGAVLAIQVFVVFAMLAFLALAKRKSKQVSWCLTVLLVILSKRPRGVPAPESL